MSGGKEGVAILGVFVADLAFRAGRLPAMGETIFGSGFKMGPGGKGSNQSVAAARVGAKVTFVTKIGKDAFGEIALATWKREGIAARAIQSDHEPTGAAFIYVNDKTGENAIIVYPAPAARSRPRTSMRRPTRSRRPGVRDAAGAAASGGAARARHRQGGWRCHRLQSGAGGARRERVYPLCDYVVPNETEAAALTGLPLSRSMMPGGSATRCSPRVRARR